MKVISTGKSPLDASKQIFSTSIDSLSCEMLMLIMSFLPPRDCLGRCTAVCRLWRDLVFGMTSLAGFKGKGAATRALRWIQNLRNSYGMQGVVSNDALNKLEYRTHLVQGFKESLAAFFGNVLGTVKFLQPRQYLDAISICKNLHHLVINNRGNRILPDDPEERSTILSVMKEAKSLKHLNLVNFNDTNLDAFRHCKELQTVHCRGQTSLRDINALRFQQKMVSIKIVESPVPLKLKGRLGLEFCINLKRLIINEAPLLSDDDFRAAVCCPNINILCLQGCSRITGNVLMHFFACTSMKTINLSDTCVQRFPSLHGMKNLSEVYLDRTPIEDVSSLSVNKELETLCLFDCPNLIRYSVSKLIHCPALSVRL